MNTTRFNLLTVQRNLLKILIKENILISICPVTDATASKAIDTTVVVKCVFRTARFATETLLEKCLVK